MPATTKSKRARKSNKDNGGSSRQTSLLDAFTLKASSKKSALIASASASENGSTVGDDVIDIPSSDAEPLTEELPMNSSSPITVDDEQGRDDLALRSDRANFGSTSSTGGSRDVPIIITDSSPLASPTTPSIPRAVPALPPKPVYSIFAPRKRPVQTPPPQKDRAKESSVPRTPFPDGESLHVRGPQTSYTAPAPLASFPRRLKAETLPGITTVDADPTIYSRLIRSQTVDKPSLPSNGTLSNSLESSQHERIHAAIPLNHWTYPAISRFLTSQIHLDPDASNEPSLLWNDKWRPRRADEVLGNEQSALYLRDWLLALKLYVHGSEAPSSSAPSSQPAGSQKASKSKKPKPPRGTKRPRIVRNVERKRRRVDSEEPEDAWIAPDSEEDDPLDVIGLDSDDFAPSPLSRLRHADEDDQTLDIISETGPEEQQAEPPSLSDGVAPFSYTPFKFGDTIYNTIILSGPPGCGKTASVYACADELGWDVFEVYPGIGERSGSALQKLIGEVGRSHLVKQTQHVPKPEQAKPEVKKQRKLGFFGKRVVSDDEADAVEPPALLSPADSMAVPETKEEAATSEPAVISQSIVLVEEVDVLYQNDKNFWPALIKIINECRRPVVMTCNDISLVPLQDLPLQTVLSFAPCPTSLAASYLQLLCLSEDRLLENIAARSLWQKSSTKDSAQAADVDRFLYPQGVAFPPPDLRQCINQLQLGLDFDRRSDVHSHLGRTDDQSLQQLQRMAGGMEIRSSVDSGLRRPQEEILRDLFHNSVSRDSDNVEGLHHLVTDSHDFRPHQPVTFSTYNLDEAISDHLLDVAQHHDPILHDFYSDTSDLHPLHTLHCSHLVPILDKLRVPREQLIRDPAAVFLDYEPWIRFMVSADDAVLKACMPLESTTRQTRNSQRSRWANARYVLLDGVERDILGRTALGLNSDKE